GGSGSGPSAARDGGCEPPRMGSRRVLNRSHHPAPRPTKHEARSTKHEARSTKHEARSTKHFQTSFRVITEIPRKHLIRNLEPRLHRLSGIGIEGIGHRVVKSSRHMHLAA